MSQKKLKVGGTVWFFGTFWEFALTKRSVQNVESDDVIEELMTPVVAEDHQDQRMLFYYTTIQYNKW